MARTVVRYCVRPESLCQPASRLAIPAIHLSVCSKASAVRTANRGHRVTAVLCWAVLVGRLPLFHGSNSERRSRPQLDLSFLFIRTPCRRPPPPPTRDGWINMRAPSLNTTCTQHHTRYPPAVHAPMASILHGRPPHLGLGMYAPKTEGVTQGPVAVGENAQCTQYDLIERWVCIRPASGPAARYLATHGASVCVVVPNKPLASFDLRPNAWSICQTTAQLRTTMRVARHTHTHSYIRMHRRPWDDMSLRQARNGWQGRYSGT